MSAEKNASPPNELRRTSYDFVPPAALLEFMSSGWIDQPSRPRPHPQTARFAQRRAMLSPLYRGTYVIVPAGRERIRANDTPYRFRTASDFAYLAGDGDPGAVLVLEPDGSQHRSLLFVLDHNRGRAEFFTDRFAGELWVGQHRGVAESQIYYGVDECRPLQGLYDYLQETREAQYPVRVVRGNDEEVDKIFERTDGDDELAERAFGDAPDQRRLRARRTSQSLRDHEARLRGCDTRDAFGSRANARSKRRFGAARASKPTTWVT